MAYSELIKNLDILRTYIRSFYIYGFKTRNQFFGKSPRTYDDEKHRLENYLDGYMTFRPDENGKVTFLSIDSRYTAYNPLYKIFKAKSFTAMDISLHFMLMEYLGSIQVDWRQKQESFWWKWYWKGYTILWKSDISTVQSTKKINLK